MRSSGESFRNADEADMISFCTWKLYYKTEQSGQSLIER